MTTIDQGRDAALADAAGRDTADAQARAERVAAERRQRRALLNLAIRAASLASALALWQWAGSNIDPVLFTTPSKVALAAVDMIRSGELWTYLWPSLVVLGIGLSLAAVAGVAIGLLLARYWLLDVAFTVYITFLYSIPSVALVPLIVLWAGFETTAKVIILFMFAFFPMVINTYQGVKSVDPADGRTIRRARCADPRDPAGGAPGAHAAARRAQDHGLHHTFHR